jgi:hypothetical protein
MPHPRSIRLTVAAAALGLAAPVAAQTAMTLEGGLGGCYRGRQWLPLRVTLTNAGAPAQVEVRARFPTYGEGVTEHRLRPRDLPNNARETHLLYLRAPETYTSQQLLVDLIAQGRKLTTSTVNLRLAAPEHYLVYGIGRPERVGFLNALTNARLAPNPAARTTPNAGMPPAPPLVGLATPDAAPARWQALQAADLVVLGGVSERDLTPEQAAALREYVVAGGTLAVTGGLNWNRLTAPFYRDLLPLRVTGGAVVPAWSGGPAGPVPVCTGALLPGARVLLARGGRPLLAARPLGLGRVVLATFDPAGGPAAAWPGGPALWTDLLREPRPDTLAAVLRADDGGGMYRRRASLVEAPYSIPQLDIPAFYVVGLFLAAYIVVLVPGNYLLLKRRDRKEWAWLTTPLIILGFSGGAYLIGYVLKGGATRVVQVGLLETRVDQPTGALLTVTGIFSPRKTGYDVRPAWPTPGLPPALLDEPPADGLRSASRIRWEDGTQTVEDFGIDMWSMRALAGEAVAPMGRGVRLVGAGKERRLVNDTPWVLEDCRLTWNGAGRPVGSLRPGQSVPLTGRPGAEIMRGGEVGKLRGAVDAALAGVGRGDMLRGWVRDPLTPLEVDGRPATGIAQTLVAVHLDGS